VKKPSIVVWCWLWYLLAQCADMATSLRMWGNEEGNPFFRDPNHAFVASHALLGKSLLTLVAGTGSYLLYKLIEPIDQRVATLAACVAPIIFGWAIWQVANNNIFFILRWVNF
jgi:hypothetical protein